MKTEDLYDWIGTNTARGGDVRILIGDKVHEITDLKWDDDNNRAILLTKEVGA